MDNGTPLPVPVAIETRRTGKRVHLPMPPGMAAGESRLRIMASIKLPDGSIKELPDGSTVLQLAESIGKRLAQAAVVGKVDGSVVDLATPLTGSHEVSILTDKDPI